MTGRPILQTQFERRLWRALNGGGLFGRFAATNGAAKAAIEHLSSYEGTVSSGLLTSLMDRLNEEGMATSDVLSAVATKARVSDCTPYIRASEILLEKGDVKAAGEMLSKSERSQEVLHRSVAEARVLARSGDREGAKAAALRAYESDPSCDEPYAILAELDPNGEWPQRHNIQQVFDGRDPTDSPGEGRMQDLYRIYYEWFRGSRETASAMLARSRRYAEGDRDFILASARMSVDEGDWHSAEMMYGRLLRDAPAFLHREFAEAVLRSGDHRRALEILADCDQTSARTMRDIIEARLMAGDHRETMVAFRVFLDSEWAGSSEYLEAVRVLIGCGMDEEAGTVLRMYTDSCGNDADSLILRSELSERSGDLTLALVQATEAAVLDKGSPRSRARKARVYLGMGDRIKAGKECARILADNPEDPDALQLMIRIQMDDGDYESALSSCRKLMEVMPADVETLLDITEALVRTGSNPEAVEMANRAVRLDGTGDTYVRAMCALLSAGPNSDAAYMCREAEERFPRNPSVLRIRGNIEYSEGDYLKASASYAAALGEDPGNPALWYSKGMSDEARGDMDSAEDAFDKALSLDPEEPDFWIAKASSREARGDQSGAMWALDRAMELDRSRPYPVIRKAILLSGQDRFREALRLLEVARTMDPDNGAIDDEVYRIRQSMDACVVEEECAAPLQEPVPAEPKAHRQRASRKKGRAVMPEPVAVPDPPERSDGAERAPQAHESTETSAASVEEADAVPSPGVVPQQQESVPETVPESTSEPSVQTGYVPEQDPEPTPGPVMSPPREDEPETERQEPEVEGSQAVEDVADVQFDGDSTVDGQSPQALEPEPEEVPEPAQEPEPEANAADIEAMYVMARSLNEAGDHRGALRTLAGALEADPSNVNLIRLKAEILLATGDQEGALEHASKAVGIDPEDADAHKVMGQVLMSRSDLDGALRELDFAVSKGADDADVYAARGEVLERMGSMDRASECYSAAVSRDPDRLDLAEKLARMMYARREAIAADSMLNRVLRRDPRRMSAIILKAEIAHARKDEKSLMAAYDYFRKCPNPGPESTVRMVRLLEDSGHSAEAKELVVGRSQGSVADNAVKRYSERALRRAFTMRVPPTDPDLLTSLGLDHQSVEDVRAYLGEQPDYGPINPGSDAFARMESLSKEVVMKLEWKDLEHNPKLPLERVFVQCGCEDIDAAKEIVSYVHRAMLSDPGRNPDPRLSGISMRLPKGISVYEIMRECDLGVYEAKVVQSQIV